jgi:hypothetical protein
MKKKLRKIVVDGRQFVWVLPGNSLEFGDVHLSVFASKRTQPLRIDPFPWAFTVRPSRGTMPARSRPRVAPARKWRRQAGTAGSPCSVICRIATP